MGVLEHLWPFRQTIVSSQRLALETPFLISAIFASMRRSSGAWTRSSRAGRCLVNHRCMEQLPYIDEHSERVEAAADAVWIALLKVLRRQMGRSEWFARLLGCDPARGTPGFAGRPGETVPGFRVVESQP